MRGFIPSLLLGAVLCTAAAAQDPAPTPSPTPPPVAKGEPPRDKADKKDESAADKKEEGALPEEPEAEMRIRADKQGQDKGHSWARGFVDLQAGEIRILADSVDLHVTDKPDGTKSRKIVAEGSVVFMRGEERLSGKRLTMDLDASTGVFEEALGYVQPGVFIEGRRIERLDASTYRIEGGKFTSCAQPTPRWSFSTSTATLHVDDHITARNVMFKVKQIPAFYLPYLVYPIEQDQRSTGILFPHFGYSSARGFNLGTGFFWAMGRSFDQTFYVDDYSTFGYGLGHEFRYALKAPSRGSLRTYGFRPKGVRAWDYDFNWTAVQDLPGGFRANLLVRQYSNLDFQQRIQESLDLASRRTRTSSLSIQRNFKATSLQVLADSTETFFSGQRRVNRHLPTLTVSRSPQKLRRGGVVFGYEARADELAFGDENHEDRYSRFDLAPRLSRPLSLSFLQLTPQLQVRYTRYGASSTELGLTGGSLDRRYLESSVEMRGPSFSKVFANPFGFYTDRFKHVIGPEVTWTYRSGVDDFAAIPKFDGNDYFLGTNEVNYALVQRLYAKRPGRSGKLEAYELVNWRVAQTYYVQIGASEFDPNYSSSAFGPGGIPDHNSPIHSRLRFRPTPDLNSSFDLEYDVNFNQLRRLGLSAGLNHARGSFQASWSRAKRVAQREDRRTLTNDTLRGSGRLEVLPGRVTLEGSADYDLLGKVLRQSSARVRYGIQCCGFMVEVIQSDFNVKKDRQFRFSVELANIGSIGNFMGQEADDNRRGFGAFR